MSNLDRDARDLLATAKKITGGNASLIEAALKRVLERTPDPARRVYLRNELGRRLRRSLSKK